MLLAVGAEARSGGLERNLGYVFISQSLCGTLTGLTKEVE
jgi:hypothetical protein